MVDIRTRVEFGWPKIPGSASRPVYKGPTKNGMVAHYNGGNTGLINKSHSSCIQYWKNVRRDHMNNNGWSDIGYSYGVCPHGHIFEGRGFGYVQAAQPNGNSTWISCTFMSGPTEDPTKPQLAAWHRLRNWLMKSKGVGKGIKGHSDFYNTACPGDRIRRLIKNGTLANAPRDLEEDEMNLPMLGKGDKGYDVKTVRGCLYARGYVPAGAVKDSALRGWLDNLTFDDQLDKMVRGFQSAKDLVVDGIVGPKTWAKLLRQ